MQKGYGSGLALLAFFLLATPAFSQQCNPNMTCGMMPGETNPVAPLMKWDDNPAQPLPYQPNAESSLKPASGPTVRVKLTDGKTTWYERLAVPEHAIDRQFWMLTGLSLALTIADVENSRFALSRAGTTEANPLFGSHPSRGRYYAVTLPILAANAYMSYRWRKEDAALAYSGLPGHRYAKWYLPSLLNSAAHAVGLAVTLASTGR